jgi:16S rRNA (adenine1518-N6/adenine1519-N6)-dimethyltransferase
MSVPRDQHFLINPRIVERILSCIEVRDRKVLEIGPGTGVLTRALLEAGAKVIAVELDYGLCEDLRARFHQEIVDGHLVIIEGDAARVDLPPFDCVVANLPYSLSSKITFRLLELGFEEAVLMYQKEFAQRMLARPGTPACGRLSVMAQTYADIEPCFEISPRAFSPMPKVRSMVLRIVPHAPRFEIRDPAFYTEVVRVLFSHRRKTVRNGLRSLGGALDQERLERMISRIPEDILSARPEELQLEDFALIANTGSTENVAW